jgi:hypothetical protein
MTGQCLDNRNGSLLDKGLVQQWPCNNTSNTMLWSIQFHDGWEIRNARSGKCLDIAGGSTGTGVYAWQYHCTSTPGNPTPSQRFVFVPAGDPH